MLNLDITMGPEIARDMIHLPVIRALTRNLEAIYPEIMDETKFTLSEQLRKEKKVDGMPLGDIDGPLLMSHRMDHSRCQYGLLQGSRSNQSSSIRWIATMYVVQITVRLSRSHAHC